MRHRQVSNEDILAASWTFQARRWIIFDTFRALARSTSCFRRAHIGRARKCLQKGESPKLENSVETLQSELIAIPLNVTQSNVVAIPVSSRDLYSSD